jgi:hypothetical protein
LNQSVSSLPASAVASLEAFEIQRELSEKVMPMDWFVSEVEATSRLTIPAMLMPKSNDVEDCPVKLARLLGDELAVKASGKTTGPWVLCTETGRRVRDVLLVRDGRCCRRKKKD